MKLIWEEADIRTGRVIASPGRNERWIIGYRPSDSPQHFTLVSLTDGMIAHDSMSATDLAKRLTDSNEFPAEFVDSAARQPR